MQSVSLTISLRFLCAAAAAIPAAGLAQDAPPVLKITLGTPPGQMRYAPAKFDVRPGQKVQVTLENNDEMPHNIVFCKPGGDKGMDVAKKAWDLAEKGPEKHWLPEHDRIIAASKMVQPHAKETVAFTAPSEPGDYPFVCTFPGHAMSMNGVMRVAQGGPRIAGLKYKLYRGSWSKLPDFAQLKPEREGDIPEGMLGWRFGDYQNEFGFVFTGSLRAEKKGNYRFFLTSDDGSAVYLDGQQILNYDGVHPSGGVQTKDVRLEPGDHELRVTYFENGGQEELYVAWAGPGFSETALSEWVPPDRADPSQREPSRTVGIPLAPEGNEAVIYRNFINDSSPRGIAVGYPGGINLCYDADQMNLALMWRGAFIDAKQHWSDRGAGNTSPLGYAIEKPVPIGVPMAVLADAAAVWPARQQRAAGFQFKGYTLDKRRFPTFRWQRGALTVEEAYEPHGDFQTVDAKITRILRLSGTAEPNLFLRAAAGGLKEENGAIRAGANLVIKAESGNARLRQSGGHGELLIPVDPAAQKEIRISYQWAP